MHAHTEEALFLTEVFVRRLQGVADALRVASRSAAAFAVFAGVALAGVRSHRGGVVVVPPEPAATAQPASTSVGEGASVPLHLVFSTLELCE